ncbi:MAG: adenosylcobinamide-GDP ribazoletransferase [Sphaerochaeta sp.]|nr:adenosylcobinamide-GDP ribazoletransferase [Sphaerochaeta sp.]
MDSGFSGAFRTLTRFSVPGKEGGKQNRTLFWFPFVGLVLGLFASLLALLPFSPLLRASLIVAFHAYATRGFHLDGLCDMADGFGGGWDKEQTLRIMRDSHVGSFAIIALSCTLLVQVSALSEVVSYVPVVVFAPMVGRFMQVLVISFSSYAREGKGTASALVTESGPRHCIAPFLFLAVFLIVLYVRDSALFLPCMFAFVAALCMALFLMRLSKKRLQGVTGDVLGAVEVLCETSAYIGTLLILAIETLAR